MDKKIYLVLFVSVLILLAGSFASAGFLDNMLGKITGKDISGTASLNVTIGNTPPTIDFVAAISAITPNEGGVNYTEFIVNVTDSDGVGNLDDSSVEARFELNGGTTRVNDSCIWLADIDANSANYSCTVGFYYFDNSSSSWIVNVTALDTNSARVINATTNVQFSLTTSMVTGGSLGWSTLGLTSTNTLADGGAIIVNNTGNANGLTINVTAYNLQGIEVDTSQFIYAANITVNNVTADCAGGTTMINGTVAANITKVDTAILENGNNTLQLFNENSGQEELYFCITAVNSDLSAQNYSSDAYGSWSILIVS